MLSEKQKEDLKVKGYTVVENVLSTEEADNYRRMYSDWVKSFNGVWPHSAKSLMQRYKVGHMEPAWAIRLKAKRVFQEVWGTEKLLTSFDAIDIGRPPEDGEEDFHSPERHWLHIDQGPEREGLHAYQGAVYLETTDEDDWAFEVIEGSHEYHDRYYEENEYAIGKRKENPTWRFKNLRLDDIEFFTETIDEDDWPIEVIEGNLDCYIKGLGSIEFFTKTCGLKRTRVPVGKGGIVLWDSRLVHANARPIKGRKNPGRWRYVVFVCMTPAKWADEESLELKRKAYEQLRMTVHWPSNGIGFFSEELPPYAPKDPNPLTELPPSAKTTEAKQLAGILPYEKLSEDDIIDPPKWRMDYLKACETRVPEFVDLEDEAFYRRRMVTLSVFAVLVAYIVYLWLL